MSTSSPRVTVVMPTLNQARFLERAICSVLDQRYPRLEFIVIDGGSSDDTQRLLSLYEPELSHVESRWDSGPAEAINAGLLHATGDIIHVMDSDDVMPVGTLDAVVRLMNPENQPRVDWLVGDLTRIDEHDRTTDLARATAPDSLTDFLMHDRGLLPSTASFFRRSLLERHGAFDSSMQFAYGYEMAARLLAAGHRPTLAHRPLCAQRDHAQSLTRVHVLRQGLEYVHAAERHGDHMPLSARYALWRNCQERRLIYALAEAESAADRGKRHLWAQLLRHPWWLGDSRYRQRLAADPGPRPAAVATAA
jgi:hypothetical protein